ncbi:hypothetical protein ACEXQD_08855 [Herbiconiux sp. P15]|uniref:hypothetical protein n=1 Tax=Herbiconiux liukaitaii TaxID=3342799 RepID=UPI0035BA90B4
MAESDEFGYPLHEVTEQGFLAPVILPPNATEQLHQRHADAYAAYQERFRTQYMSQRRSR